MEQIKFELLSISRAIKQSLKSVDNPQQKKVVGSVYIVLSLFAISFFGIVAISPTVGTISNLRRQLADSQEIVQKLDEKITALSQLATLHEQLRPELEVVYNAIPTSPQIPTFTRKIESVASQRNLAISQFSVSSTELYPAAGGTLYKAPFSILLLGTGTDVTAFISDLITIDRLVTIETISAGRSDNGGQAVTVTGNVYFDK